MIKVAHSTSRLFAAAALSAMFILNAASTKAQTESEPVAKTGEAPATEAPADAQPQAADASLPECGSVMVARFSWPTSEFVSTLVARLLQDGYGCDVEIAAASPQRAVEKMRGFAEQARRLQNDAETEEPSARVATAREPILVVAPAVSVPDALKGSELIAAGPAMFGDGDELGFAMPEWFAATRILLLTLADVAANPDLFAPNGGRPILHLCPVGWACYEEGLAVARAHKLQETFDLRPAASGVELVQSLIDADRERQPWIGYFWAPSAAAAEHPLRFIPTEARCPEPDDAEAALPCKTEFAIAPKVILFDARLAERAPEAAELLTRISIPREAIDETMLWRRDNGASAQETVDRFIENRPGLWARWMGAAAAARVEAAHLRRRTLLEQGR